MAHSLTKILVHAIWSTKYRQPLILQNIEKTLYDLINHQLTDLGCPMLIINGMPDHVHTLFFLNPNKNVSEVIKQVKGSSSHFINQQNLIADKFSWQTGYAAFSVSESVKDKTFSYIRNQKAHHTKKSFQEEYENFIKIYGNF